MPAVRLLLVVAVIDAESKEGENAMNEDTLKGQWMQLKGKVREKWGKLTDDDVERIHGQSQQLVGRVQERYGIERDEAERQVNEWMRTTRHEEKVSR